MHAQTQAVQDRLQFSKDLMKEQADKKRRAASFSEGDLVFLNTRHIRMGGSRKLKPRYVGPFKVLEVLPSGNACRLELPELYEKLHDVFNVALLKKVPSDYAAQPACDPEFMVEEE